MTFHWVYIFACFQKAVTILNGIFDQTFNLDELFKTVS